MFGAEWVVNGEPKVVSPWTEFEERWFEMIRKSLQSAKDIKKKNDAIRAKTRPVIVLRKAKLKRRS